MKLPKTPVLILMALLAMAAGFVAWKMGWVEWALAMKEPVLIWCRSHPIYLFAAIAILPGFGFPVAPLLILAGAVWGSNPFACGLALLAVIFNISWTHTLAAGWGRKIIMRVLGSRWDKWKLASGTHDWRLALILRITPGIPLCIQNYLLGLLNMPLWVSAAISIPTTGLYVCGFVLTGGAIFEGQAGLLLLGLSILIAASLTLKIILKKISNRNSILP
jgi:uncharacterized membrane protein YdjX (TVP38/TMEM64 family)